MSRHTALVVGAGSIGSRHARNLAALGVQDLIVHDTDAARAARAAAAVGGRTAPTIEAGLALRPSLVFVCTPPTAHVAPALSALRAGAHVFLEKPLAASLDGLDELAAAARASGCVVQVGYNLRFVPAFIAMKAMLDEGSIGRVLWLRSEFGQYLPDWRPQQDYRASYTARRELGGGIILDASHELDYVLWFLGRPTEVRSMVGRVSRLELDVEDCATILLRFASGAQADVHLDCVQRSYSRGCRVVGDTGTIDWSAADGLRLYRPQTRAWEEVPAGFDRDLMYADEVRHFLECVERGGTPRSNLETARMTLEVALTARECGA